MVQGVDAGGQTLLEVQGLRASVEGLEILKGVDLTVKTGEVHAIMGPNGSGKSTLANVLAGKPDYQVTSGQVLFQGADIPDCPDGSDLDDDGRITLTDVIVILNFLFRGGVAPAAPYPEPGQDPTADGLQCQ